MSNAGESVEVGLLRQQSILARFGELALRSDDLDEILTEACRLAGEALGTDLAKVVELQEDGTTLLVRAGVGWKPGVVGVATITAADDTSEGHALKTGEPMISPDIATETRFKYPPFLVENGVRAVANVIIIGGHDKPPFGILQVDSREPRQFTDNDTAFLRSYANLLAATVDRLRVIEGVRNGEASLRLALEAGALGSWNLDLASGAATRTPRHDQIFGHAQALPAWSYDTFLTHVLPEDCDHVAGAYSRAVDGGTEWRFQCRIRRADDGEVRWIEAHGRPDGGRGNRPAHMLGIVADITERKRAEEALAAANTSLEAQVAERTAALAELNAQLDAFAYTVSHDLRAPLRAMEGFARILLDDFAETLGDKGGRYATRIVTAAERMEGLINDLLAYSRLQRYEATLRIVDPTPLAVRAAEEARAGHGKGVAIEVDLPLPPILGEPVVLGQVLVNLIGNAAKFRRAGEQANIAVRAERRDGRVRLWVEDDGIGIAPEHQARIFNVFERLHGQEAYPGSGIGLAIVKKGVERMGGNCGVESELGRGSRFWIELAAAEYPVQREKRKRKSEE